MTTSSTTGSARGALRSFARRSRLPALALAAVAVAGSAAALPPTGPGDTRPLDVTVSGSLTFRGCLPSPANVTVRIAKPARTGRPGSAVRLADGSIRMNYRIVVGREDTPGLPEQFTVRPQVDPAVCGSAAFQPSSRTATRFAQNVNFELQARNPVQHFIPVDGFLLVANAFLTQVRLHLNNDQEQSSSVTIGDETSAFDIPAEVRDLPFPLPGSGLFTIRNMDLQRATIARSAPTSANPFDVSLRFESDGVEVKGYHSTLGDLAMPDFQMSDIVLGAAARLGVRNGQLVLGFTDTRLQAGIASTGACNVFGLDWCNHLFGASGKLRSSFELQGFRQLNGSLLQGALTREIGDALTAQGIVGPIGSVAVQGDLIVVTTIQ